MTIDENIMELNECVQTCTTSEITCRDCHNYRMESNDSMRSAAVFYAAGWRSVGDGEAVCPECVEKRNILRKHILKS